MKSLKHNPLINSLEQEPYVDLPNEDGFSSWNKTNEVVYNQISRQREKARFFTLALDFINEINVVGDYFEFGCHRCRTFRMVLTEARRHNLDHMGFLAFDSFEGLPGKGEAENINWDEGTLITSEKDFIEFVKHQGIYVDKVKTYKGFYDKLLNQELQNKLIAEKNKIALVTIDCDLYESAVPVFEFIDPLLQPGSVIYIDDIFGGYKGNPFESVGKAFIEFQKKSKWAFVKHLNVGWWGRSYIVCNKGEKLEGIF